MTKYPRYFVGENCPHKYWLVRDENTIFVKLNTGIFNPSVYQDIDQLINKNNDAVNIREVAVEELALIF